RKCSGRNVMNANGFKKFEHDRPYGRFSFRQNLPVCIQHHGSGIPPARRSQPETTDTNRCRSSSRVIRSPEEKPNMAYLLLTETQKKGLQGSGQENKKIAVSPERLLNRYRRVPGAAPDQSLSASGVYTG
ncbi:hypothetical protein QUG45_24965, partial [Enterobacter hormaechei]|uniref:hypothetical protein n=1 Tax=Enterobacter hormaechei TaxID=158836 RepID=UPI00259FEAB3